MLPNPYIIHLEDIKEREKTQTHLQDTFGIPSIPFFPAIRIQQSPKIRWQLFGKWREMSLGELGCNASHVALYKSLIGRGFATIFEDDAVVNDMAGLTEFLKRIPSDFDIILLGYADILDAEIINNYRVVYKFNGTHAMILSEKARAYFIDEYDTLLKKNESLPTDWLWSHCISKYGLKVYAPLVPSIIQIEGLISSISGHVRRNKRWN